MIFTAAEGWGEKDILYPRGWATFKKGEGREWGKYEFFPDQVLKQQCFLFTKEGLRATDRGEFADLYFTFAKKTQSRLFERVTTQT